MDIEDEEWVNIPYGELLEVHDDDGEKIFSRKHVRSPRNLFKMDYFNSPQKPLKFVDSSSSEEESRSPKQLIPLPIQTDDHPILHLREPADHQEEVKHMITPPTETPDSDIDPVFQVFFKKENEFVEMKMDSPRSGSRGITLPYIETGPFQYEERSDDNSSPSKMIINEEKVIKEDVIDWGESNEEGMNIWKWGMSGIGAFCSLGMAVATICIIILGNGQKQKQNHKLRVQIYSDDKRIKQVVEHANEAMSAVRGVPLTRAHITFGGYYEGL